MIKQHSQKIKIVGASQNNLKDLNLEIPLNKLVVVTGPSGAGKSSLVIDTIYAEGQRRYVQSFSPYARQFLERLEKPVIKELRGLLPAIAIEQANPVRTSRSTVGTMTEIADYLKLLFAKASNLYCDSCGEFIKAETPQYIYNFYTTAVNESNSSDVWTIEFKVTVPKNFSEAEAIQHLMAQGYSRITKIGVDQLSVIQDRFKSKKVETLSQFVVEMRHVPVQIWGSNFLT